MKWKNFAKQLKPLAKLATAAASTVSTVYFGPTTGKIVAAAGAAYVKKSTGSAKKAVAAGVSGLAASFVTEAIMRPADGQDIQTGETKIAEKKQAGYNAINAGYEVNRPGSLNAGGVIKWILYVLAILALLWLAVKYQPWKHLKLATA